MIRYGISWRNFLGVMLTALLCVFTKSTVTAAIPLAILALLFGLLQGKKQKYAWVILGISFIGIMVFAFRWDDAAHWQHVSKQTSGTRVENSDSPFGSHAIQLQVSPDQKRSTPARITVPLCIFRRHFVIYTRRTTSRTRKGYPARA